MKVSLFIFRYRNKSGSRGRRLIYAGSLISATTVFINEYGDDFTKIRITRKRVPIKRVKE